MGLVVKKDFSESAGVAFEQLLLATFDEVELDVSIDGLASIRSGNCKEGTPLPIGAEHISNNLSLFKISWSLKYLNLFFFRLRNAYMIDWGSRDDSKNVIGNPVPEHDILGELDVGKFLFLIHVEYLEDVAFAAFHRRLQSNDILLQVHDWAVNLGSGPFDEVEVVEEFDDCELRGSILVNIPDGDVAFGLEVSHVELEEFGVNFEVGNVLDFSKLKWWVLHSN